MNKIIYRINKRDLIDSINNLNKDIIKKNNDMIKQIEKNNGEYNEKN